MKRLMIVAFLLIVVSSAVYAQSDVEIFSGLMHLAQNPVIRQIAKAGNTDILSNPPVNSEKEIAIFRLHCFDIVQTIDSLGYVPEDRAHVLDDIKERAILFLIFSTQKTKYSYIRLDDDRIPVLKRLHKQIHSLVPQGYAFVQFSERDDDDIIESNIGRFEGVTAFVRFIEIKVDDLEEVKNLRSSRYWEVLEHELVHVYINSIVGVNRYKSIPEWFEEGCALYFANNKPDKIVSVQNTSDGMVVSHARMTEEYCEYLKIFQFLSSFKGKRAFEDFVTDCLTDCDPDTQLIEFAGVNSFQSLLDKADAFRLAGKFKLVLLGIAIFFTLCFFASLDDLINKRENSSVSLTIFLFLVVVVMILLNHYVIPRMYL